jgi:hypothetical protein
MNVRFLYEHGKKKKKARISVMHTIKFYICQLAGAPRVPRVKAAIAGVLVM